MSELRIRQVENGEEYEEVKVRNELATPETLKPNEYMLGSSWTAPEIIKLKEDSKEEQRKSAVSRLFGKMFG
ncbi:hypothetical protein UT300012_22150 [Paraclostridium bifermentans]